MIFGIGTDIIEVKRIKSLIEKGPKFKERIFTSREIEYCDSKRNAAENYAARFAAKEAFLKAIGMGWRRGFTFKDIEIMKDNLGKPEIRLYGKAENFIRENGISKIQVSLSHIKEFANAIVTLERS